MKSLSKVTQRPLVCALILNMLFLAAALAILPPAYEAANDDLTIAAFADGQMAVKCAHIPYINFVLALLLKSVYTLFGEAVAWYAVLQYVLLFWSFTLISAALFERLELRQAAAVTLIMLLFFGVDGYMYISYTKTAGVCAVGGMVSLLAAAEQGKGWRRTIPGTLLCLFGFLLRKMEFLPCMAITAMLALRFLYSLVLEDKSPSADRWRRFVKFAAPFAVMLVLCAGSFAVDKLAWSRSPWREWAEFDAVRVDYSDYGRPDYDRMPEQYDALGLTESAVKLLGGGNYFDGDNFGKDTMAAIRDARDELFPKKSVGECLGRLLDDCIPAFFVQLPIYALLAVLLLWLAGGEHELRSWLALGAAFAVFALCYLYLIYRGRYLIDRVDCALFLALFAVAALLLDRKRLGNERLLCAAVLLVALFFAWWKERDCGRTAPSETLLSQRQAVERLLEDEEHIYFAKLDTVNDALYSPFTPMPRGYWDRIVLLGGWDCNHPALMQVLARYGVQNPYRDSVGNGRVYFIEDDIDLTLQYIREYYDPGATAELVEPVSSETGLTIYSILSGGAHG